MGQSQRGLGAFLSNSQLFLPVGAERAGGGSAERHVWFWRGGGRARCPHADWPPAAVTWAAVPSRRPINIGGGAAEGMRHMRGAVGRGREPAGNTAPEA